jgi:hypothetical protein
MPCQCVNPSPLHQKCIRIFSSVCEPYLSPPGMENNLAAELSRTGVTYFRPAAFAPLPESRFYEADAMQPGECSRIIAWKADLQGCHVYIPTSISARVGTGRANTLSPRQWNRAEVCTCTELNSLAIYATLAKHEHTKTRSTVEMILLASCQSLLFLSPMPFSSLPSVLYSPPS